MKHLHTKIKQHLSKKKNTYLKGVLLSFAVIFIATGTFFITKGSNPHTSELAFIEHSAIGKYIGSVVPASCDSNADGIMDMNGACPACPNGATNYAACSTCPGGQVFSGGVCQNQTWTSYCTPPSDPNPWQVWQYDNGDARSYRNTGASCNPTPSIGVAPANITWGTASTISWSSANTSSCTATGSWGGAKATGGSQTTGALTAAQSYGIYCTNGYGQNSSTLYSGVSVCSYNTPTWTGSACVTPVGNITSNACTIVTNASSCSMNVAWTVTNPPGLVEVRRPYAGNSVLATGATGNNSYVFPYSATPYTLDLYDAHRNEKLDDGQFSATCAVGGWDSVAGICVDPRVTSVTVTGQYYSSPGTISFTCSGANNYIVRNTDTNAVVALGAYSGPTSVSVGPTANYGVICGHGDYLSNATLRYYNAPPPPLPVVSLVASPRTVVKDAQTTLTWDVQWPVNACTFTAKSVCTNGSCNAAQLSSEAALTTKLRTESTDATDASGVRTINNAIRTIAPGHIDTDWKALGKKTVNIANTMDITLDCGTSRSATTRVQVTSSNEQ